MQDQNQPTRFVLPNGGVIVHESAPEGQLPPTFLAELAAADVVLLIGSSETKALTMRPVIAGGEYNPQQVASHAFVAAIYNDFDNLMRHVKGEATDAQRYQALREFSTMAESSPERFEVINKMIYQFEEDNPIAGDMPTAAESDKMADFIVHAVAETTPKVNEPQPAVN